LNGIFWEEEANPIVKTAGSILWGVERRFEDIKEPELEDGCVR
jgi:hypothetical protein